MNEQENVRFFNKGAWKAVLGALIILVAGEMILAWQYHRLEKKRLPQIEQKLAEQELELEKQNAQNILEEFFKARIAKEEARAIRYLAEGAMLQRETGGFELTGDFQDFEIQSAERTGEDAFVFQVALVDQAEILRQLEVVRVRKILEDYYIDFIELAG